jgi:DNA-directed RNA polymerase specialized sigma24 family protein
MMAEPTGTALATSQPRGRGVTDDAGYEAPELPVGKPTISDRIAAFAMLDQMTEATQAQECMRLSLVGFSASEIAEMLQTSVPTVHQNLYTERKRAKSSEKAAKASAKKPSSARARARKA